MAREGCVNGQGATDGAGGSRFLPRGAGLLALMAVALSILLPPAESQNDSDLKFAFTRLQCIEETGLTRLGSDEPYVLILVADLRHRWSWTRTSTIFSDVDRGESRNETVPLWPWGASRLSDLVYVAAILESDNRVNALNAAYEVRMRVNKNLPLYLSANLPRQQVVQNIRDDMRRAIDAKRGGDSVIAQPQEILITGGDTAQARRAGYVLKTIEGRGDSSHYVAHFQLTRAGVTVRDHRR